MALDGAFLHTIQSELTARIGARIDKIHQPSREEIVLVLRWPGGSGRLLLSASASNARIHFTSFPPENPKTPPMFCMLLRKHLGSGKLVAVRQLELDRVLTLDFETTNELGDLVVLSIAVEIMGRHSNIIVIGPDGKILDAVKRVDNTMSGVRMVLPGLTYTLPPLQNKLNLLATDDDTLLRAVTAKQAELSKAVLQTVQGFSPILAREVAFYVSKGADLAAQELTEEQRERLRFSLSRIRELLETGQSVFTTVLEGNTPKDFSFINITQYGNYMKTRRFERASELLDHFYAERDRIARMKQRSHDLLKLLVNTTDRISRKLEIQSSELAQSERRDEYRVYGDLLNSNLYRLEKGMRSVTLENFYEDNQPVTIPLDPLRTPAQNAQKYYNEYKKAITAERMLTGLIEQAKQELVYIDSVFDAVSRTSSESELLEIREELAEQGYIKKGGRSRNKALKPQPPLQYKSTDGFTILCGRNNKQNDKLTTKTARGNDLWCHTKNIPGSHVVVLSEGREIPDSTIEQACVIAAYNSKAREGSQVPVDYTLIKNVKKPNGAKPGMVIFVDNRTAYITPDEELVSRLRVN